MLTHKEEMAVAHQHRAALYSRSARYARAQAHNPRVHPVDRLYLRARAVKLQRDAAMHYRLARKLLRIE